MSSYLPRPNNRTHQRRIGWLLIGMLIVSVIGLPAASPKQSTDKAGSTERFPCENSPCGCSTAAQCWDRCCCHSDIEKLCWAAENGVTPPAFLVERVAASERFQSKIAQVASKAEASSKAQACSCCAKQKETTNTEDKQEDEISLVLVWKAAQCQGLQSLWNLLSVAWVIPQPVTIGSLPKIIHRWIPVDESADSCCHSPIPPIP